jgi:hypothetical protein
VSPEEHIFNFWMEYFIEGINEDAGEAIRFPVILNLLIKTCVLSIICLGPNSRAAENFHAEFCQREFGRRRKVHPSGQLVHRLHEGQVQAETRLGFHSQHDQERQVCCHHTPT